MSSEVSEEHIESWFYLVLETRKQANNFGTMPVLKVIAFGNNSNRIMFMKKLRVDYIQGMILL
jgi:hypothetical protein